MGGCDENGEDIPNVKTMILLCGLKCDQKVETNDKVLRTHLTR